MNAIQLGIVRLVRTAEAQVIGDDRPEARFEERWDKVPIEGAPGRVAVQHDHRPGHP